MSWLKRSYRRDWLQRSPSLNTIALKHELWNRTIWELKPEAMDKDPNKVTKSDYMPVEQINTGTELIFSIGSEIIIIHANDNLTVGESLKDFINKMIVLRNVISDFVRDYPHHVDTMTPFTIKKFLNSDTGASAMFTSTAAMSITETHGYYFEVSSCDNKARLYITSEKEMLEITTKILKMIAILITEANTTLDTYKGRI